MELFAKHAIVNTLDSFNSCEAVQHAKEFFKQKSLNRSMQNENDINRDIDENVMVNDSLNNEQNLKNEVEQTIDDVDFSTMKNDDAC